MATDKFLMFTDHDGNVTVLESVGEFADELAGDSRDPTDWSEFPEPSQSGLAVWEGEILKNAGDEFRYIGNWRDLTTAEWDRLAKAQAFFKEHE